MWLADIAESLEQADRPQYYVSDLREGHVKDVRALRKHGELTHHPNYGGGVTLGLNFRAAFYVNTADQLGNSGQIVNVHTRKAVKKALEQMAPGVTAGVDLPRLFD